MVVEYTMKERRVMQKEMWGKLDFPPDMDFLNDVHIVEGVTFTGVAPREDVFAIRDLETKEDDIFIIAYPKSGTHWMWEICLLILAKGDPDKINRTNMYGTAIEILSPPEMKIPSQYIFAKMDSPRVMFTHLPWQFLPKQATEGKKGRVFYIMRNPKDIVASYSRFIHATLGKDKDEKMWAFLFNSFLTGTLTHGSWFDHVQTYWKNREQENVFFASYEGIKLDFKSVARPLSKFLLADELDYDSLKRVEENASMKGMKKNYDNIEKQREDGIQITRWMGTHSFIQKGAIGSWKTFFTVAENELFDEVCKEKMCDWDIKPVYEV